MKLITKDIEKKIPKLYDTENIPMEDKVAYVKYFNPINNWTWYGIEYDGEDRFFGYVKGFVNEFGYFSLFELKSFNFKGLGIERDMYFKPTKIKDLD